MRLRPDEWTSGDILWLAHAAGEPRFVRDVLKQLNETAFKGREVKVRALGKDGKPAVQLLPTNAQVKTEGVTLHTDSPAPPATQR